MPTMFREAMFIQASLLIACLALPQVAGAQPYPGEVQVGARTIADRITRAIDSTPAPDHPHDRRRRREREPAGLLRQRAEPPETAVLGVRP